MGDHDNGKEQPPDRSIEFVEQRVQIIQITAQKNASDLGIYLTHEVRELLKHRIRPDLYREYYDTEVKRIVGVIHKRAKGDFSLARIIVANLQQPSKLPLEEKIKRLPDAIGEMYMTALESLTDDQQELIVTALKWIVWGVSGLTAVEISDHYREVYRDLNDESWNVLTEQSEHDTGDSETGDEFENTNKKEHFSRPKMGDIEDPEVRDVIHHLETTGRDFFKYDSNTGFVGVDISIREWIQGASKLASKSQSVAKEAKGFRKQKTQAGYTVFSFTLTRKAFISL
ncbi:hypothetical protein ABW20_dc0107068 [Dactylellina cionopaga]|nr:hypothetical protein ABW20_dc0107068 [Dactylellina cionopaga]